MIAVSTILENKTVYQSSTDTEWEGNAEKAVDGIFLGNLISELSCSLTQSETHAWWAADLGDLYFITGFTMLPRTECCCELL